MRLSYKEPWVQNVDLFTSKQQYLISTCIFKMKQELIPNVCLRDKWASVTQKPTRKRRSYLGALGFCLEFGEWLNGSLILSHSPWLFLPPSPSPILKFPNCLFVFFDLQSFFQFYLAQTAPSKSTFLLISFKDSHLMVYSTNVVYLSRRCISGEKKKKQTFFFQSRKKKNSFVLGGGDLFIFFLWGYRFILSLRLSCSWLFVSPVVTYCIPLLNLRSSTWNGCTPQGNSAAPRPCC